MRSVLVTKRLAFSLKYISNSQDFDTAVLFSISQSQIIPSFCPPRCLVHCWHFSCGKSESLLKPYQLLSSMRYATHYAVHWGHKYVCFKCTYNTLNSLSNRICTVFYRLGGAHVSLWVHGSCCVSRHPLSGSLPLRVALVRAYSAHHEPDPPRPTHPAPSGGKGGPEVVKERALAVLKVQTFLLSSNCIFFVDHKCFCELLRYGFKAYTVIPSMQGSLGGSGVRGRCRQQVPLRTTGGRDTRSLWG